MVIAYLGLGSNMGDKKHYLQQAIQLLNEQDNTLITKYSSLYETEPWGYTEQAVFMNLVVEIETQLSAEALLKICQQIEQELERVREVKWGPRTMDIDILLYNNETIETEDLKVPHPYLLERDFTVIPLAELAPDLRVGQKQMHEWAETFDKERLKRIP